MKILLRIQDIHFLDKPLTWWQQPETLAMILKVIDNHGLWQRFGYYGERGQKRQKLTSLEALVETGVAWKKGTTYILVSEDVDKPSANLDLDIQPGALTLRLGFDLAYLGKYKEDILSHLIGVVCDLHDVFGPKVLMGPLVNVEIIGSDYPQPRPPRSHIHFTPGAVVTIICQNFHTQHKLGSPVEVQKMLAAPMPEGAQKIFHGDLVIFRWADNVTTEKYVQECRSRQAQWLAKVLELPPSSSYNDRGDYRVTAMGIKKDPLLTFYDSARQEGYKTVVIYPDGTLDDEELFVQMQNWIQQRQLPDGRPLKRLNLVLPNRESALQIHERANKIGLKGVYYIDNQGHLWDPFPPGLWIKESFSG